MKTYKQFIFDSYNALKDRDDVQEAVPLLIPAALGALKLAGKAYAGYTAYQAAQKAMKGDYTGAALDVASVAPIGGMAFKGARALGAGQKLATAAKRTGQAASLGAIGASVMRDENPTTAPSSSSNNANSTGQRGSSGGMTDAQIKAAQDKANADRAAGKMSDLRGGGGNVSKRTKGIDPKKLPGAGLAIRTDLSSPTMRTKSQAEAEQGIEKDKPASTNVDTSAAQADAQAKERQKAEAKKKAEQALKKKNQELNDKLRPDFAMAG